MPYHSKFQQTGKGGDVCEIDKVILKCTQRVKDSKTPESSLKNNSAGGLKPPDNQDSR